MKEKSDFKDWDGNNAMETSATAKHFDIPIFQYFWPQRSRWWRWPWIWERWEGTGWHTILLFFVYLFYIFVYLFYISKSLTSKGEMKKVAVDIRTKRRDTINGILFFCIFYIFVSLTSKVEMMKVAVDMRTMRRDTIQHTILSSFIIIFVSFIFLYLWPQRWRW